MAATGGKEAHRGSGNLPHANIYITHSPASVARGWGWFCLGVGWGVALTAQDPARSPIRPLLFLPCLLGVGVICSIFHCFPCGNNADCSPGKPTAQPCPRMYHGGPRGPSGPLTWMFFDSVQGRGTFRSDSFVPCDQETAPINLGWTGQRKLIKTPFRQTALH